MEQMQNEGMREVEVVERFVRIAAPISVSFQALLGHGNPTLTMAA
jgi:hypothetical protein